MLVWVLISIAQPRPSDGPPDLVEKAYTAAEQKRYCDAIPLFLALHERAPQAKHLYRAAEVAFAAGDHRLALDLYRSVLDSYPAFEKRKTVEERIEIVTRVMRERGPGVQCPEAPALCGDWIVRPGEQCDDGNSRDGDGCDANCTLTACGNGIVTSPETCDDGNLQDGDGCDGNCTPTSCGNGVVAGTEECDDANPTDGDGCDRGCRITRCGNGVVTDGEECDDGNDESGDGCDSGCTSTRCGNGILTKGEQCDDGNLDDGDGCDTNCTMTSCGNGVRTAGEQCDDGNLDDGDACTTRCVPSKGSRLVAGALAFAGSTVAVSGVALSATGLVPLIDHATTTRRVHEAELRAQNAAAAQDALDDARALQRDLDDANRRWLGIGVPLVVGGAACLVVGAGAAIAGMWLWGDKEPPPLSATYEERVP